MQIQDLGADQDRRQQEIVDVLFDAFEPLIEADERAFRRKFRKMARDPFAFYRGSAPLFYKDVDRLDEAYVDEQTARVWIQGDLHAENYGTYMDAEGVLVFDVNDFDEAYLGHYTWDLQRMAASLALLGYAKALSDERIRAMTECYGRAYLDQVLAFGRSDRDDQFRLTLENSTGPLRDVLLDARLGTRVAMLDGMTGIEGHERVFLEGPGVRRLDDDERGRVLDAYQRYLETIPDEKRLMSVSYDVKDVVGRSGFGIGSAGLQAYNLLVEGRSQALDNDVVLSMKQGNVAAPSRVVTDEDLRGAFKHEGHRTVLSQRALQAHSDPWLGWCELDGTGWMVKELSPYEADLDWGAVNEPDEIEPLLRDLGRATAKVHCVSDSDADQSVVDHQVEESIAAVVGDDHDGFATALADFAFAYGAQARTDHQLFVDAFRNGRIPGLPAG